MAGGRGGREGGGKWRKEVEELNESMAVVLSEAGQPDQRLKLH